MIPIPKEHLYFFVAGILALIAGYVSSEYVFDLVGLGELAFWLVIWILLNATLVILLRKKGKKVTASMIALSFFAFILSINALLAWGAYEHMQARYVCIEKVECAANCTEVEILKNYPALKRALEEASKKGSSRISPEEWEKINLDKSGCIEYNGSCYRMLLVVA